MSASIPAPVFPSSWVSRLYDATAIAPGWVGLALLFALWACVFGAGWALGSDLLPGDGDPGGEAGIHHFCLSVRCQDMAVLAAQFAERGATVEGEVRSQHGAYGISESLYLIDPDGYRVELKAR